MNKIVLTLVATCSMMVATAQAHSENDGHNHGPVVTTKADESLQFKQTEHDFGQIPQGKPAYYTFEVVNKGTTPMKLDNVAATCGCTTPEWSREPIAPGATAQIRVGYNAAAEGYFEKFITITYNTDKTQQLKIKGTVWKAPAGSAPTNASIDFLKKQTL